MTIQCCCQKKMTIQCRISYPVIAMYGLSQFTELGVCNSSEGKHSIGGQVVVGRVSSAGAAVEELTVQRLEFLNLISESLQCCTTIIFQHQTLSSYRTADNTEC